MFPQTLSGIQLSFAGAERARAIGLYAIALSGGAVAGQILGGVLVSADVLGRAWRAIFFVNVPCGCGHRGRRPLRGRPRRRAARGSTSPA